MASSLSESSRVTGSTSSVPSVWTSAVVSRAASLHTTSLSQVSKPPEKVAADAVGEIERLQAATAALGDSTTLVKHLQEVLRVAQTRASVPPGACVQRAQESIDVACEQKVLYEAEVVEGGKACQARGRGSKRPSHPVVAPQVLELQARIDALVGTRRIAFRSSNPCSSRGTVYVDGLWSPSVRRHPTNSHIGCPGSFGVDEPTQLQLRNE